jgi:hypothetical protein
MKTLTILFTCLLANYARTQTLTLVRMNMDSKIPAVTEAVADQALRIASAILSSKEFRDSLAKRDFKYQNLCEKCGANREEGQPRITGQAVLTQLYKKNRQTLNLDMRKTGFPPPAGNECFLQGKTCPGEHYITSYYKNIMCEMGEAFPFEYAYGVHLCHEYMHDIGYCHTDRKDDVAETAGRIAFNIMNSWYKSGKKIL